MGDTEAFDARPHQNGIGENGERENLKVLKQEDQNGKKPESETKFCDFCQSEVPAKATRCRFCSSFLSKKSQESNQGFSVLREESEVSEGGFNQKVSRLWVLIQDEKLKQVIACYLNNDPRLFESEPKINAEELFTILPALKRDGYSSEDLSSESSYSLVQFLTKEYESQKKKYEGMIAEKRISFEGLSFLFVRGTKIFGHINDHKVGTEVLETNYVRTMLSTVFAITGEVVKSNGDKFYNENCQFVINQFKGTRSFSELNVQPLDDETVDYLRRRGEAFSRIAIGNHYIRYEGTMLYKTTFYTTRWRADGRAMVDCSSFNKTNADYGEFNDGATAGRLYGRGGNNANQSSQQRLSEDSWYKTWPSVGGFSFTAKKWGELFIDNIHDVTFDDTAFERLVLPEEKKNMVKAMVQNAGDSMLSDVITGKGAGCIFLLHGPPGCGKTLTAEAIAELLHRPLYSVGVGELGTTTERLEKVLKDLLDVASVWNAVVLIDEADIFLERRTEKDIMRNAMVGIFLRLLEYHQGILFLTTNRVEAFDDAFHSRISVCLRYEELALEAKRKVWDNFLTMADIRKSPLPPSSSSSSSSATTTANSSLSSSSNQKRAVVYYCPELDPVELSSYKLNGRQIRNVVRLATALAKSEDDKEKLGADGERIVALTMKHFHRAASVAVGQLSEILEEK